MAGNTTFARANRAKNDEFYTQLVDVEAELRHYRDQLRGKIVLCNCDDPYESAFFQYFAMNFSHIGLKRLITTSYGGSPIAGVQLALLDTKGLPEEPPVKSAYLVDVTEVHDANNDGAIDLSDVEYLLRTTNPPRLLAGSGDFRSDECIALLKQADVVVTNPPFSLFREFIGQLVKHGKQVIILGGQNAITYGDIFTLIEQNRLWLGYDNGGEKWFRVPNSYVHTTDKSKIKVVDGIRYLAMKNMAWFTNLDTTKRHDVLTLYKRYTPDEYPRYANYDAIEVGTYMDIPLDYDGAMGVPITFLARYNPEQFEILGTSQSLAEPMSKHAERGTYSHGGTGRFYLSDGNGRYRRLYDRIVIRPTGMTQ